jgi:hypothetical protein
MSIAGGLGEPSVGLPLGSMEEARLKIPNLWATTHLADTVHNEKCFMFNLGRLTLRLI